MQEELITREEAMDSFCLEIDAIGEHLIRGLKDQVGKEALTKEVLEIIEIEIANTFGKTKYLHAEKIMELKPQLAK